MTTQLPFSNNTLQVFAYEGFSYTLSNPNAGIYTLSTVSNSTGFGVNPSPLYFTKNGNTSYVFSVSDLSNNLTPGTQESFVVQAVGPTTLVSSNIVNIGAGRFLDGSGQPLSNNAYTFYKNEPIPPIRLVAPSFTLKVPTTVPSLPPGLSFVQIASNIYDISGIPLVTAPLSNYLVIGAQNGGSKIVTTRFNLSVSNERVQVNLSGSPIINNMTVGSPIVPRVFTAIPPVGSTAIRYTFPPLPDGIVATDVFGNVKTSPATITTDPSYTLILSGTPTLAAANAFRDGGATSSGVVYPVQISRTNPLPTVDATQPITFAFGETVLFDTPVLQPLYAGVPVDPSLNYFRAATYFAGSVDLSDILSPDLRSDLSLAFIPALSRANLFAPSGSPGSAGTGTFTIRAINSNGITRDLQQTITVSNDSVSFTSPVGVDLCYTFILSRPVSQAKAGYYPGTIQFSASAVSGLPVALSAPALGGTGLSLASNGVVSGIPTSVTPLTDLVVTATVSGSPATATANVKFSIVDDAFTFGSLSSNATTLLQNKAMTPVQVTATTLSGRNVVSYSATGLPAGVSLSSVGVLSGTPTADGLFSAVLTASTGFSSGSSNLALSVRPDNLIVALVNTTETVPTTFSGVEFDVLTYSGKAGTLTATPTSNRAPQQGRPFSVSFASNNLLQGDFSTLPALLPRYRFAVTGDAGSVSAQSTVNVAVANPSTFVRHLIGDSNAPTGIQFPTPPTYTNGVPPLGTIDIRRSTDIPVDLANPSILNDFTYTSFGLTWTSITTASNFPSNVASAMSNIPFGLHDMAQSGSTLVAVLGSNLIRSPDNGVTWSLVPSSNIQTLPGIQGGPIINWPPPAPGPYIPTRPLFSCIATDGGSNWVAIGNGSIGSTEINVIRQSSDNGVTWVDTSINQILVGNSVTKLYYTNGRYVLLPGASDGTFSNVYYASASNPTSWTGVSDVIGDSIRAMALDGSGTLLVVGSNAGSFAGYSSSNNGTSWTALPTSPIPYAGGTELNNAHYAYGTWVVVGATSNGFAGISTSTDLSNWSLVGGLGPGIMQVVTEDGGAWQVDGTVSAYNGRWSNSAIVWQGGNLNTFYRRKRMLALPSFPGPPSLTLTLPFDSTGISFVEPFVLPTILWQHVPLSPAISVRAQTSTPNQFLYYYASGLPDGLQFVTNDVSGTSASIVGTSVRYSDAPQRVLLYAVDDSTNPDRIAVLRLGLRTILPTVTRQQTGAGAYTSLVRQYTLVNAAQNARDSRVFPDQEARLGEFTAPEAPDVVTQTVDPRCFDPNACV